MIRKIKNFLNLHCDFKVYNATWIAILIALAVVPCVMFLPEHYGYENGLLEDIQMLVLLTGFILAVRSKVNKKFFNFAALILTIIALREINCGRTLFFPVPGEVNTYYSWKEIKYGWIANPIYGLYMACVAFYFFKNELFITLWKIIKEIRFPVWNVLLMLVGMGLGMYAEKAMHNMVFEEITELLFYVSLTGIIYLYAYNKNFQFKE